MPPQERRARRFRHNGYVMSSRTHGVLLVAGALLIASACAAPPPATEARTAAVERAAAPVSTASRPTPSGRRLVILGDSLTAGLGLPIEQAYPSLLQARLDARGGGWQVVNAGVSGDTSAGGLRRLEWALSDGAAIVVVALGGNDALRGLPVDDLRRNLDAIVTQAQQAGARVVLAGMQAPPNTGPDYARGFSAVYPEIAAARGAVLLPFLLDGVAGVDTLNQADGIHPNEAGARRVADLVWQAVEPVVRELDADSSR